MFVSQDVLKVLTDYRMQFWSTSSSIEDGKFWLGKGNVAVYTFFCLHFRCTLSSIKTILI